jgi:hypothetical protein
LDSSEPFVFSSKQRVSATVLETIVRLCYCVRRACCHIDPSVDPSQNLPPGLRSMPRPFLPDVDSQAWAHKLEMLE